MYFWITQTKSFFLLWIQVKFINIFKFFHNLFTLKVQIEAIFDYQTDWEIEISTGNTVKFIKTKKSVF